MRNPTGPTPSRSATPADSIAGLSIGTGADPADPSGFLQIDKAEAGSVVLLSPAELCTLFSVPPEQHQNILDAEKKKPHPEVSRRRPKVEPVTHVVLNQAPV